VTTFLLCNFLNKKCSNTSPFILQPHHIFTVPRRQYQPHQNHYSILLC